jgi:rRNA biogenesis protein RRP5
MRLISHISTHTDMGPIKRKADQASVPAKKEKGTPNDRSAKRQRKSDAGAEQPAPSKAKPEISAPKQSVFKDEEKAFPRGGASVLTPLEHKQIQIKANQDVLFEQAGGQKRNAEDNSSDEDDFEDKEEGEPKALKKRKSKKSKNAQDEVKEKKMKAAGLSLKVRSYCSALLNVLTKVESGHRYPDIRPSCRDHF